MVDFLLDPSTLRIPADEAEMQRYFQRLVELQRVARTEGLRVLPLHDAAWALTQVGAYPLWDAIPDSESISKPEVAQLVATLLQGMFVDDALDLEVAIVKARCTPDGHLKGRPAVLVDHHHRMLCTMVLAGNRDPERHPLPVFTSGLPAARAKAAATRVAATGEALVASRTGGGGVTTERYAGEGTLVESDEEAVRAIDPVLAWREHEGQEVALDALIAQRAPAFKWPQLRPWSLGGEFVDRARALGFLREPGKIARLLDMCADAVLDGRRGKPHPIRTGAGGGNPDLVRARDRAAAMRRDIDDQYHLHYWKTARGPEFAWIASEHDDYRIPAN